MSKKLARFVNKRGQTSVEYILIIGVIVGVIMIFGQKFKSQIGTITDDLFGNIDKSIKGSSGGG